LIRVPEFASQLPKANTCGRHIIHGASALKKKREAGRALAEGEAEAIPTGLKTSAQCCHDNGVATLGEDLSREISRNNNQPKILRNSPLDNGKPAFKMANRERDIPHFWRSILLLGVIAPHMAIKRQKWKVGDLFKIPLADGSASLGHIVAQEHQMLNTVTCAFYDAKVTDTCPPDAPPLPKDETLIACLFTTHDLLRRGVWPVIGHITPQLSRKHLPYEDCRQNGWVGASMYGSGIVREFLDAYYRLAPWDDWADPKYLDGLLIDPAKRPKDLIYVKPTDA